MPVTAKLSRKFYERLGDDVASELVDWFNAVDSTYQQQLREVNERNWERFKAQMDAGFEGIGKDIANVRADMIKWMFIFWCGNMIGLGGLIVGLKFF